MTQAEDRRLLFFLPRMDGGGAEKVMLQLLDQMAKNNIDVELVLIQKNGVLLPEVHESIQITELGSSRAPFYLSTILAFLRLIKMFNQRKPERILSTLTGMNLFVLFATLFTKHSPFIVIREAVTLENHRSRLKTFLVRLLYPRANSIVCVSHEVEEDLREVLGPKNEFKIINNPVQISALRKQAQLQCTHPWISDQNVRVICCMGRLSNQKGFDVLLKAFSLFKNEENVRLLVLGEGELRQPLAKMATNLGVAHKVDFLGFQQKPFGIISRCQLYVLSSRWEGFVNSLLEVIALGVPVVSTDCRGGPRQILAGGKYGALVPVDNVEALHQAMRTTLESKVLPKIPEDFFREYSIDSISRQYINLYQW